MNKKNNKRVSIVLALVIAFMSIAGTISMPEKTKVATAAEVTSGVTSDGIIWGGRGSITETLTTGAEATVTLTESVIKIVVDSTTYPFYDTQVVGSTVIARDDLLHIFWYSAQYSGNYYCMDLRNGNFIKAYKNKSNNKYCLAMNANSYEVKGTSVLNSINTALVNREYFYENHYMTTGNAKKERLITRLEFEKLWDGKDPSEETDPTPVPTNVPTQEPTPTANVSTQEPTPTATPIPTQGPTATQQPMCGCINGGVCTCPVGTCTCNNCSCNNINCKPTPAANVLTCNCVNGGVCNCPQGTCTCNNCSCSNINCKPTPTAPTSASTNSGSNNSEVNVPGNGNTVTVNQSITTTITNVNGDGNTVGVDAAKETAFYAATKAAVTIKRHARVTTSGNRIKLYDKKGNLKTWIEFNPKKGTVNWNGHHEKKVKTTGFIKKSWNVGILKRNGKVKVLSRKGSKKTVHVKNMRLEQEKGKAFNRDKYGFVKAVKTSCGGVKNISGR